MTEENGTRAPIKLEGQYKAIAVCWFLGLGSLVAWNSMLTISDYYYNLFPVSVSNDAKVVPTRLSTMQIFKQNIDFCLDLFLIYVLTLSIFPGFIFENTGKHQLGSWYPLVLIAMYNVLDLISRYIPLIKCLKIKSRKGLLIAILSRFLFVPAYYFTGKYADQGWMILLTSILGLTNGYLTVCVMTVAPKGYNGPEQNALGNILVLCLLGGIFAGVCLDWLWLIGKGTF
ncbi:unnamed protein product [Malus baccata var. baccata]